MTFVQQRIREAGTAEIPPIALRTVAEALGDTTTRDHDHEPSASTVYRPRHALDLREVLSPLARGGDGPGFRRTADGAWLTFRTPDGPATLRLGRTGDEVHAAAWGHGAEWAIDGVPQLLGESDDWSELDVSQSSLLTEVRRRHPGVRLSRNRRVFEMLVPSVIEQKVTCTEAWRSWRLLVRRHGTPAPGPAPEGMWVAPDAASWRRIPSWEWHAVGVGPQRSEAIVRASRVAEAVDRTAAEPPATASARLQSLPGIGAWTAAEVTARSHGDPDAVSVGDYHLPASVGCALVGEPVDDDAMLELLEPWAGQRQRVLRLIALSGIRKPRRGPRITRQDHRWH
ncbi:DNA-3-methyladenine glycosylase family protein [Paramicrobacterium agarici]|uniref:3-methyladenine DNA glycosylase/8-oxoguanine DNA glycosylase n=1 Tax=Paramicrobacterium agarici TaxID=630514 RepID=A0A2A9DU76_9MICO|nr:DNA-3-methyladenine glycosylase 2 family protein [Microbacterium agarici]PFG29449.1 3-methyladenine DNA glycosylase/8-oxoguanine DNA glycosylase [Microbacterium agarici]